jgi:small subunit ribosomal protein S19e
MVAVTEVPAAKLIEKLKEELKKVEEIKPPAWASFAKSGSHRERPPQQKDFWYVRTASLLRKIYLDGPVGISRLRTYYGGRKRRGYKPAHFRRASGNVLRKILQQLEKSGFVQKDKKGRKITSKGQKFMDKVAYEASK